MMYHPSAIRKGEKGGWVTDPHRWMGCWMLHVGLGRVVLLFFPNDFAFNGLPVMRSYLFAGLRTGDIASLLAMEQQRFHQLPVK